MTKNGSQNAPFEDLLIVDIGGTIATGYAGKLYADYGARVVNVEPEKGFATRRIGPFLANGESALHGYLHANKEHVVEGNSLIDHPAVAQADLVLLDPNSLPSSLVLEDISTSVCAISWFGLHGAYAQYQGTDQAIYALTGLMRGVGKPGEPPVIPTGYHAQILGGVSAFNGSLAHLFGQPDKTSSFFLDASILEANLCLTELGAIASFNNMPLPQRMGINRFAPTYPLGIWPCKDGWLGVTVLNPSQWLAFCELLGLPDLAGNPEYQSSMARLNAAEIIEPRILEALASKSAEDLFYQGQGKRIPLARVPTMHELFSVDQYRERQVFSEFTSEGIRFEGPSCPFRLMETPPRMGGDVSRLGADNSLWDHSTLPDLKLKQSGTSSSTETTPPASPPLEGVTIVDLSMGWAGPLATRNLADLGAKVIKVESCTRFDWFRSWEASQEWIDDNGAEKAHNFIYVNRQKLGVTIDFETKSGRNLLLELVKSADAVVDNYPTGVLEKLNLDYQVMRRVKPDLVMLSMPAFGRTGPWAKFRAYGSTVEQAAGLPHLQGDEQDPPTMLHVAFGDAVSGLYGTAALLTALRHKRKTGVGQFVDLSQAECMLPHAVHGILCQSVNGHAPARQGNRASDYFVHQVFPCKGHDQWLLIQIKTEAEWEALTNIIPVLRSFSCLEHMERRAKVIEIEESIEDWTRTRRARDLMTALQAVHVPAAILNDVADLMEDPHLVSREYMQFVSRDFVGAQPHPSAPWRLGERPISISRSAPTLGQHNQEILSGLLGLSNSQIASLSRDGVIGNKPRLT